MILTRERIELISFSPIYQLFTLYQTSSNCSINGPRKTSNSSSNRGIDRPPTPRKKNSYLSSNGPQNRREKRALNGYFISSTVEPCSFCDSPCIIPIDRSHSHHSPTIPRAVVTGEHVALWIALPAQGAPFPRNKVDGWGFNGKKKEEGRRWFPRTRGMAGSLHRHRRGVLPD